MGELEDQFYATVFLASGLLFVACMFDGEGEVGVFGSHRFFQMVRDTGEKAGTASPVWDMLRLLFSRTTVLWLGIALLLVLIPAHLVWLFERRRPDGIISSPNYFPGIFEAFFWAISTLTGSPEGMPHQWVARTFAIFWIFAGVVFVAFYTAQLTTTLTVERISGAIEGPSDLPGKQVATVAGSTAVDYLRQQNAQVQEFHTPDQSLKRSWTRKWMR